MSASTDFSTIYLNWIRENVEQFKVNDSTFRLTLPFLDRNNDCIEVYIIKREDGTFFITDDGATLNDLDFGGFDVFSSDRRKAILTSILSSYGVSKTVNNELTIECTMADLALKKHMLAQCMVKVSDMFYLSKNNVQSIFLEDVQSFFDVNNIRYVGDINIIGKSKLISHYDFAIAHSQKSAERLVKVVNNLDLTSARSVMFNWSDTREVRRKDSVLYAFIQDSNNKRISADAINALKEYDIIPALWSEKEKYVEELSA